MSVLTILWNIVESAALLYLGIASVYIFVFAFAGLFRRSRVQSAAKKNTFAVMIPGYKEDEVIVEVARKALEQDYPADHYRVFVIADSFQQDTLKQLNSLPISVIEVSFDKSTKAKALNKALEQIDTDFDAALILDADNIMEAKFLEKINAAFNQGNKVVQGRRVAKNSNTSFAILDGISESINNHIFRQGHRALGLSSGIIGSGMAFDFSLFKELMHEIKAVGGFDKELEFRLFERGLFVEYIKEAVVYDEKIQQLGDFKNQRRRWLSTKSVYFSKFLGSALRQFFLKGNLNMADKLYQMIMPPRVLLLGGVLAMAALKLVLDLAQWNTAVWFSAELWYGIAGLVVITFIISTPKSYYTKQTFKAALSVPKAFVVMFGLLFKLKGANKTFIHTKHNSINNS
ncbi:glycosyltransferase family 2 protein [Gilvibacter sp.]|uniref:glycosyltransferase n=1 Tax=Gilvibacter sp. TaxID=2729997 RepID=UPI0025C4FC4F|nr:glycosyltransferase family 2 protein [Gilvibacter sp.]